MTCVANAKKQDYEDLHMMEFSAKAAGLTVLSPYMPSDNIGVLNIMPSGDAWSPLHDDGDALRLAVKLKLDIEFYNGAREIVVSNYEVDFIASADYEDDMNAATRRAIVRAAAEIGRTI